MTTRNFIVATAGHVDHGKSALVKALSGTDPDRLPDEKARGITIDLGFAELDLAAPNGETLHTGIIDVPGHEDFVRNMIAGVGSIDLALFVVAADDGWMPQTEEHLQILTYLNVDHAVFALTKTDLVDATKPAADVREQLSGTRWAHAPIVETSTVTAQGLEQLKTILARELSSVSPQPDLGKPRLFVDRVFSLRGIGTVVTGTLIGGCLRKGQHVVVQPRGACARIRAIQNHGREHIEIGPGTRTALNLSDVDLAEIRRGDVVTLAELGEPVGTLGVVLTKSTRVSTNTPGRKNVSSVYLHHGTGRTRARLALLEENELKAGRTTFAQLRLEEPVFAFLGDRFVLRDPSERRTLAGGVVLDLQTTGAQLREPKQHHLLLTRAQSPNDVAAWIRSELQRDGAKERSDLFLRSNFDAGQIAAAIRHLVAGSEIVFQGELLADANAWSALRRRLINAIEKQHEAQPHLAGIDLTRLRAALAEIQPEIFDALVVDLCQNGYRKIDNYIKRSEHRAALPPNLTEAAKKIRGLISQKPFDPPPRKQIAPDPPSREALRFLIEQGEVIEIGDDLLLEQRDFASMRERIGQFIVKNGPATVSELRQLLQSSRRVLVPLLEHLDRERFTQRMGDRRKLRDEIVATSKTALD